MNATIIQQGDQYYLPVKIKHGTTVITDSNSDDVKIKIGDVTLKASDGALAYGEYTYGGETENAWLFPLSQIDTINWNAGAVPMQVQIKIGANIMGSATENVTVGFSTIEEAW